MSDLNLRRLSITGDMSSAAVAGLMHEDAGLAFRVVQSKGKKIKLSYEQATKLVAFQDAFKKTTTKPKTNIDVPLKITVDLTPDDLKEIKDRNFEFATKVIKSDGTIHLEFATVAKILDVPEIPTPVDSEISQTPARPTKKILYPAEINISLGENRPPMHLKAEHIYILHTYAINGNEPIRLMQIIWPDNVLFGNLSKDKLKLNETHLAALMGWGLMERVERGIYKITDMELVNKILEQARGLAAQGSPPVPEQPPAIV